MIDKLNLKITKMLSETSLIHLSRSPITLSEQGYVPWLSNSIFNFVAPCLQGSCKKELDLTG